MNDPLRYGHEQVSVDGLSGLQANCSIYTGIVTKGLTPSKTVPSPLRLISSSAALCNQPEPSQMVFTGC